MRIQPAWSLWIYAAAGVALFSATLTCSGGSSLEVPSFGTLRVTTSTGGAELDADGYTLQVDGGAAQPLPPAGTFENSSVQPGDHILTVSGIAGNCGATGENPRTVNVEAGKTTAVAFDISCQPTTGTLQVTTATSGPSPDADGYSLLVDGTGHGSLDPAGQVVLTAVAPGAHLVGLTGVSANCRVDGENPKGTTVTAGATSSVAFVITCSPPPVNPGSLRIRTNTTGPDSDADGYTYTIDGANAAPIGVSAQVDLDNVSPAVHTIALSGVATNCTLQGTNSRSISVASGVMAEVSFVISCSATTGSIRVSATTAGADLDGNGYSLTLDGIDTGHLDPTGNLTIPQIPAGSHLVALADVAANCAVADGPSRNVTVAAGATVEAIFAVTCAPIVRTAAKLELVSGNGQNAGAGQKLANPAAVRVLDAANAPLASVTVTWAVTVGGGSVSPISGPTNAQGIATTEWTLGNLAGPQSLTATVSGLTPVTFSASATESQESQVGQWTPPFNWGSPQVVGVHLHLLPNGRVLTFGFLGAPEVWDPSSNSFTVSVSSTKLVCSGHAFLPDGRLLVTGGHIATNKGVPDANIFDPASGSFTAVQPMAQGRWYPTTTTLSDGELLTVGGADANAVMVAVPEVWTGSGWRRLTSASQQLPYYPWMFQAPDGRVFYAGPGQMSQYLDASGSGSWTDVGNSNYGSRDAGTAVMYEPGKVLIVGGGGGLVEPGLPPTNTAETIDLNSASPQWTSTGSMATPRRHLNATLLPTGDVLVVGGTSGIGFNNAAGSVRTAEIWSPSTGIWKTVASNAINRIYHSTALLLPDARVLVAGAGENFDAVTRMNDVNQFNAEIYSPPYLFRGARPVIGNAPVTLTYGGSFTLETVDATSAAKVTLIRLSSVTHSFNQNQRFMSLSFRAQSTGLSVDAPANSRLAPPGDYLLFVVNGDGVPSVGRFVNIR
jgi:Domain of unknown function (DUF1929)